MKAFLLGILLLAGWPAAHAQGPTWQLAIALGGGSYSEVSAVATDAAGNVYLTGWFSNSSLVLGRITLTNAVTSGSQVGFSKDVFVAKWSPATQDFVWAQRAGGTTDGDYPTAIIAANNAVYVATSLVAAPVGLGGSAGGTGYYLTKLTDAGMLVWAQPLGGPAAALAISGNALYAAGSFSGAVSFGSHRFTSAGSNDLYLTKLTDAGASSSYAWALQGNDGFANAVAVSGSNVYIAGSYYRPTTLGGQPLAGTGAFVAKLTDTGAGSSFGWVQPLVASTPNASGVGALALAVSGAKVYVAGSVQGTVALGATSLTSFGYEDLLVARLTDTGPAASIDWTRQAGGAGGTSAAHALVVAGTTVYVAGTAGSAFSFDAGAAAGSNAKGVVVAKLTDTGPAGRVAWVQQVATS